MIGINSVVIIDSCEIDLFISSKLLANKGVKQIISFKDQHEALDYLTATAIKLDLIIVANNMQLMSGFDFIKRFRELELDRRHGKIILLSAFFTPDEEQNAIAEKIEYFLKPFEPSQISN